MTTFQQRTCTPFIPVGSFRKPHFHRRKLIDSRCRYRHNQQIVAKHIFGFEGISFFTFGIIIIHGLAQRYTGIVRLPGHSINIGCQIVSQSDSTLQSFKIIARKIPYLFHQPGIFRRVCSEYRTEHSILHPACIHFGINLFLIFRNIAKLVTTQVMTPVTIQHVRGSRSKIRLKIK